MSDSDTMQTGKKNADLITGAPGSHPGATGIGAGSGAATGAAIGAIGGPVGAVIGAIAGGIVGGVTGHAAGEAHDPTDPMYWKNSYKDRKYYDPSANYDRDVAPAYKYGSTLGDTATAAGTSPFSSVESSARTGWEKIRGNSTHSYDQAKGAIQDAYDQKLTPAGKSGSSL